MKTRSLQHKSSLRNGISILVVGVILVAILGFISPGVRASLRDLSNGGLIVSSGIKGFFFGLSGNRISELENKNMELTAKNSVLDARVKELETGVTSILDQSNNKTSTSLVMSQAPASSYDTLILSRSEGQNISPGSKVIAFGGIYLGEVTEIGDRTVVARLISYPGLETEAWLESARLSITLTGEGGYNLKFAIPKNVPVEVGDRVLSNTNPQMLIGEVERINERPTEPLKEVLLRFGFNFRSLRYVELSH